MSPTQYAQFGWPVLPVQIRGKTPTLKDWPNKASVDQAEIARWFANADYNVGVVTGLRSGIIVLDIDSGSGGKQSLAALTAVYGSLPETVIQNTGGGGKHYIFKHPGKPVNNRTGLRTGIDIRGDGGYIVVAPSIHPNGTAYTWQNSPADYEVAEAPQWLLDMLARDWTPPKSKATSQPRQHKSNIDWTAPADEVQAAIYREMGI